MSEYDSPWKEALDQFFALFLAFFAPALHADVDWSEDYQPQDAELHKLAPEGARGTRLADKLVRLRRQSGDSVILHIELQAQPVPDMPWRTFTYHYRATDRYAEPVASLVILGDDNPHWRPDRYQFALWGCTLTFHYPVVKLLDWAERLDELEQHANPFALMVWAHLQAQRTQQDAAERQRCKSRLIKGLYERGLEAEDVRQWYRCFDWLLNLPPERERQMWEEIRREAKEQHMPFITYAERYGIEKGLEQGIEKGLEKGLEQGQRQGLLKGLATVLRLKFGNAGMELFALVPSQIDIPLLDQLLTAAETATSIEELRHLLPSTTHGPTTS